MQRKWEENANIALAMKLRDNLERIDFTDHLMHPTARLTMYLLVRVRTAATSAIQLSL
jgi:hypothetical protein